MKMSGIDRGRAREIIREFLSRREDMAFAYLHGSFVRSEAFRDVDVAVFLSEAHRLSTDDVDVEISLSLQLEKATGLPVDVKLLNHAPLGFRYHASRGELLLTRDESVREEFLTRTWGEYFDFLPLSRMFGREMTGA